jgi:hypothetical protein
MPPRSAEEKERRRLQHEQKKQARTLAKEQKEREEAEKKAALEKLKKRDLADEAGRNSDGSVEDDFCYFLTLPEDSQNNIMCFLAARDLGAASMTCRSINFSMGRVRVSHLFSRSNTTASYTSNQIGRLGVPMQFCQDENQVRELLNHSLDKSGDTGRLVTKKSKKGKKADAGDADEYIAYARFLEEALVGYAVQKVPGHKPSQLVSSVLFFSKI